MVKAQARAWTSPDEWRTRPTRTALTLLILAVGVALAAAYILQIFDLQTARQTAEIATGGELFRTDCPACVIGGGSFVRDGRWILLVVFGLMAAAAGLVIGRRSVRRG
ncbi:MAG TPA: hypothetical protein VIT20_06390 [Propionibacteriaceae bacterium]